MSQIEKVAEVVLDVLAWRDRNALETIELRDPMRTPEPAVVEVRLGEQVRFEIFNEGTWSHEFVLATEEANRKHAELMKKFPDM